MNSKETKKYALIHEIMVKQDWELFRELADIDFKTAVEVWEYMMGISDMPEEKLFTLFYNLSETKTRQLVMESLPLIKLIYGGKTSCTNTNLIFLAELILSSKPESAEPILACVKANNDIDYGEAIRRVVDAVFSIYCTREDTKKCVLNRKQSALLLDYISKIKGPNKSLLTQRIKEL